MLMFLLTRHVQIKCDLSLNRTVITHMNNMKNKASMGEMGRNDDLDLQYYMCIHISCTTAISTVTRHLKLVDNISHTTGSIVEHLYNMHKA